jgi:hypothetical protein
MGGDSSVRRRRIGNIERVDFILVLAATNVGWNLCEGKTEYCDGAFDPDQAILIVGDGAGGLSREVARRKATRPPN